MRVIAPFACFVLSLGVASATVAVPEVEPNDSFATRQVLSPGDSTVEGDLEDVFATFDETRAGVLAEGAVDSYTITGATPSAPFTAWVDNAIVDPEPDFDPDTVLGEFDTLGALVNSNDDASPIGDGFSSALAGTVNSDGTIRLKVTGWPDFDFDGQDDDFPTDPHFESGSYTLFVRIGVVPDVDYVSFTGLTPGEPFDAEIVTSDFDTVMGRYDDSGVQVDFNDDIDPPNNRRSQLTGTVPPSGELNLAISHFEDANFDGVIEDAINESGSYEVGSYQLVLQVPEPSRAWLLGAALAATAGLARRRVRGDILPRA